VTEWLYVARRQEIEGFDFIGIFLSFVELCKRAHDGGTGNACAANSRLMFEARFLRW
jgi:hypothetical protein